MRTLLLTSIAASFLALSACEKTDPNAFETHLAKIESGDERAVGFNDIQRLVKTIAASDAEDRRAEFAQKVIPSFAKVWDETQPHRIQMLEMLRDMKRPEGAEVWKKAIVLDGSAETRKGVLLALQGISDAGAKAVAPAIAEELQKLHKDPSKDGGDNAGQIRLEYAKALGVLGDPATVPVLIATLEQDEKTQPRSVHKAAVKALGLIGDPSAAEPLIRVAFAVKDAATSQNIGERVKQALVGIGTPAEASVRALLKGENDSMNKLAAERGMDIAITKQYAASVLGAMGSTAAVEDLVSYMPQSDCNVDKPSGDSDDKAVLLRAVVANSLGFIADEKAVDALCSCRHATHNQGDMWPIVEALGRIGGSKAVECLSDIVANGEYDPETVVNSDFRYEIRWEGGRFLVLAASPAELDAVRKVFSGQSDAKAKEKLKVWEPGLKVLEECKADKACYQKVVSDTTAEWFAREKAAVELSRLAKGDTGAALALAKAFKVRDPDARVTMAWLSGQLLDGKPCYDCADALESVMKSERGHADAKMQSAWLNARVAVAKMNRGRASGGAGAAKAAAPAPAAEPAAKEEAKADAPAK